MEQKRERYFSGNELTLIHTAIVLQRALDDLQYARKLIETADDSLGDVLHYKAAVFDKLDRAAGMMRSIEADVRTMIMEAGQ